MSHFELYHTLYVHVLSLPLNSGHVTVSVPCKKKIDAQALSSLIAMGQILNRCIGLVMVLVHVMG